MATTPTFALPPSFLAITRPAAEATVHIAGIPFDIGTTNRSGARFGPAAIRQASRMLVDGDHPHWWIDPAALPVADIGDFDIALGDIRESLALIERQAADHKHLVTLGGDHSISLPLLRAFSKARGGPVARRGGRRRGEGRASKGPIPSGGARARSRAPGLVHQ